jgi:uncharacterized protein
LLITKEPITLELVIKLAQYLIVGIAVGTLSGLLGVGGGILMVPLIMLIWKHNVKVAIGTSLATMIPTAFAGSIKHFTLGNVDLNLAAFLAVGAILGTIFIGAPLANHLPAETLKKVFGVFMVVSGLQMAGSFTWLAGLFSRGG